jgi:hypothetical protein
VAITAVAYNFLTAEERRHTLQIVVLISVIGRRVRNPIVLHRVLDGRVLMALRQHSVQFANINVIQFQFQYIHAYAITRILEL